jgi:hypothetical protein
MRIAIHHQIIWFFQGIREDKSSSLNALVANPNAICHTPAFDFVALTGAGVTIINNYDNLAN